MIRDMIVGAAKTGGGKLDAVSPLAARREW